MLTKRAIIAAKVESSYNTDASPASGTDDILVQDLSVGLAEGARMQEQPYVRPSLGTKPHLYGGSLIQLQFSLPIKGSGTAGTAPEWGRLMQACGYAETVNVGTDVSYAPASSSLDSITIYYWQDGLQYKMTGARGTWSLTGNAGERAMLQFTFTGHVSGPTDVSLPSSPAFDDVEPPIFKGTSLTVGGDTLEIASLSLDAGVQVVTPADVTTDDGFGEIVITGRDVNGSIDPKAVLVATKDLIGNWRNGTDEAINTGVIGSTSGNQFKLEMPKCRYREASQGDRDGLVTHQMTFGAHEDTGDDELVITLT